MLKQITESHLPNLEPPGRTVRRIRSTKSVRATVSSTSCSLSMTQGPAIRNGQWPAPTLKFPISTSSAKVFVSYNFP
jgi:hypothetical protein